MRLALLLLAGLAARGSGLRPPGASRLFGLQRPVGRLCATVEPILDVAPPAAPSDSTGDVVVEFPEPLTPVERLERTGKFWTRAVPVLWNYFRLYTTFNLRESVLGEKLVESEVEARWQEEHERGARIFKETIDELKGFYTKCGQIIASRQDLFPEAYIEALAGLTDFLDPMPASLARAVIAQELLVPKGLTFDEVFAEFDDYPLGAASVAQVHRAVLTPAFGGKEVAVKVQRPAIEPKLMSDVANLKALSKQLRGFDEIPVDYYVVFSELERQLQEEFDFVSEAAAMTEIGETLVRTPGGRPREAPLTVPKPVDGLVSQRVLVMDLLKGVPLSRAQEEMKKRGIDPDGPEAKIFARRLLRALTDAFGWTILETGFFHGDPHPGNIFVMEDGSIGLIDFGQVKRISDDRRVALAKVITALAEARGEGDEMDRADLDRIGKLALELGVGLKPDAKPEGPAAVAVWLFDGEVESLPGGYDTGELSPNSPVKELESFPEELVLVGRSTVLIKGIAARLGVRWSLAKNWYGTAQSALGLTPEAGAAVAGAGASAAPAGPWGRFVAAMREVREEAITLTQTLIPRCRPEP
mmetsp:Transcript_3763/g.10824  ORF Transcript_3763/g.10824 Transcript_3763/m.10824 type:complete len:585 (-) Transcript_3763:426-2180(-)